MHPRVLGSVPTARARHGYLEPPVLHNLTFP